MRIVPDGATWVHLPQALLTVERDLGDEREQRIALPNQSGMAGDNFLVLRARVRDGADIPRFRLDEFLDRVGGAPPPFRSISDAGLQSREDAGGTLFWVEERFGVNTICVVGLRRATITDRLLPGDTNVMDVMLRNCINGTADEALTPIGSDTISYYPGSSQGLRNTTIRNLSPLAAPMP